MKISLEADRQNTVRSVLLLPSTTFVGASLLGLGVVVAVSRALLPPPDNFWSTGVVVFGYLMASVLCARAIQKTYPHDRLGLCNLVTLCRMSLLGVLVLGMLEAVSPNGAILALAFVTLSLDGVDGWLARRADLTSDFGARFDVEVDAAFALALAVFALTSGGAGPLVLLLGLPHYVFGASRKIWPWLNAPLPPKFGRKAVCVLQIGTLIAMLVPQFDGLLRECLVTTAVLALAWSFGRDIIWLYRTRL